MHFRVVEKSPNYVHINTKAKSIRTEDDSTIYEEIGKAWEFENQKRYDLTETFKTHMAHQNPQNWLYWIVVMEWNR